MIKKIVNHSFIYAVLPKLPILAGFFILPWITPHLKKIDYGIYGIVFSIYTGAVVLKTLGLDVILMNSYIHQVRSKRYKFIWNEIQGFMSLWAIFLSILVSLVIFYLLQNDVGDNIFLVIALTAIPVAAFSPLSTIAVKYYQMAENPVQIGVRSLFFGLFSIILSYYLIVYEKLGYLGWIWSFFLSEFLTFTSYVYPIWYRQKLYPNLLFRRRAIRRYLKIALPLVPHTSAFFILDFSDRLIMLILGVKTEKIGLYDFAYRFAGYARVFSESIHQASTPLLIKDFIKNKKNPFLRDIIFIECFVVTLASFVISLWMKEIFGIMVNNDELIETYKMGIILTMAYAYKPMYTAMATVFYYYEKTKEFWKISLVAGIINIILNLILIPIFGFEVAVLTTFLSFLYLGYAGFLVTNFNKLYKYNFRAFYWILYTGCMLITAIIFKDSSLIIKLTLTLLITTYTVYRCVILIKKVS